METNAFGMGINSKDAAPFLGSDFHMPAKWTKGPGLKPARAKSGMTFVLFGDGEVLATTTFVGVSWREHRWEHRPSEDGRWHDYGPGWVLDLDPNDWAERHNECIAQGMSYRYGHVASDGTFIQITAGQRLSGSRRRQATSSSVSSSTSSSSSRS